LRAELAENERREALGDPNAIHLRFRSEEGEGIGDGRVLGAFEFARE